MRIGRKTVHAILKAAPDPKAVLDNSYEFATALVGIIKTKLADQLVAAFSTNGMAHGTNRRSSMT